MSEISQPITIDSVKEIIRRDLNLEDEPIADDMPLIGGDMDLDSLDVLMLVTSIEKKYGIKISNEQHGREAFESVATLAGFIESQTAGATQVESVAADTPPADLAGALAALPHQSPFRFVSELVELEPGVRGVARWELKGDEAFFAGHFPGNALVPGVLIAEALAQVSGIVFAAGQPGAKEGRLAGVDVRFRSPVAPPATIELESRLGKSHGDLHVFEVVAKHNGTPISEGSVTLFQAASATPTE